MTGEKHMASIDVNYDELRGAADSIERYITEQRRRMRQIKEELTNLGSQWSGADYQQMLQEWNQLDSGYSVSGELVRDLEEQVKDLRWAVAEYEKARNRAISRAKRLNG